MTSTDQYLSSLLPFETTTSSGLDDSSIIAMLNFAALFHDQVYLSDTTLGDYSPMIRSFNSTNESGVYTVVREFIRQGIVKAMYRDKVVVRGKMRVPSNPTLVQTYEGWVFRDREEWNGDPGITSHAIDSALRYEYYEELEGCLQANEAIIRYDVDANKRIFRNEIRRHIENRDGTLASRITLLPNDVRSKYEAIAADQWSTNAEFWRLLKPLTEDGSTYRSASELLYLHGHLNQQVLANVVSAGQSVQDSENSLLSRFHPELSARRVNPRIISSNLDPPKSLESLLESAEIIFDAPEISQIALLSVDDIVELRKRNERFFKLLHRPVERDPKNLASRQKEFIGEMTNYWKHIVDRIETKSPKKMKTYRTSIWLENQAPWTQGLYEWGAKEVSKAALTFAIPIVISSTAGFLSKEVIEIITKSPTVVNEVSASVAGVAFLGAVRPEWILDGAYHLSALLLQHRTELNVGLRQAIPPRAWRPSGLERITPR